MSLDMHVYTRSIPDSIIPQLMDELNKYEMLAAIHPDFLLSTQTGFLPFKFTLINPPFEVLRNKELISGFELYKDDFSLAAVKGELNPTKGFFGKLLNGRAPEVPFASAEIDKKLQHCTTQFTFVWHVGDSFEPRFALLASAILAKLTDGVCCYPADDFWYNNDTIVEDAYNDVKGYERSIKEDRLRFHEFTGWE